MPPLAPLMERLEICFPGEEEAQWVIYPSQLLGEESGLKHLKVEGCRVGWVHAKFGNLRSLFVARSKKDRLPPIMQLLRVLSQTPLLESFTVVGNDFSDIVDMRTEAPYWESEDVEPVWMEHLKEVKIQVCSLFDAAFILDHLVLGPQTESVDIRFTDSRNVEFDVKSESVVAAIRILARRLRVGVDEGASYKKKWGFQ
ncbi:hypothetical protein C0995_004380, partial [Termitomyces sp. Mi166